MKISIKLKKRTEEVEIITTYVIVVVSNNNRFENENYEESNA